jgi:hypothetical protein
MTMSIATKVCVSKLRQKATQKDRSFFYSHSLGRCKKSFTPPGCRWPWLLGMVTFSHSKTSSGPSISRAASSRGTTSNPLRRLRLPLLPSCTQHHRCHEPTRLRATPRGIAVITGNVGTRRLSATFCANNRRNIRRRTLRQQPPVGGRGILQYATVATSEDMWRGRAPYLLRRQYPQLQEQSPWKCSKWRPNVIGNIRHPLMTKTSTSPFWRLIIMCSSQRAMRVPPRTLATLAQSPPQRVRLFYLPRLPLMELV